MPKQNAAGKNETENATATPASSYRNIILGPLLPQSAVPNRRTLVLDMDRTILVAHREMLAMDQGSHYFELAGKKPYVYERPGLASFLTDMARLFEIVVFTLSDQGRADRFLDKIDRDKRISFRLYRKSADQESGKLVKNLSLLGRE